MVLLALAYNRHVELGEYLDPLEQVQRGEEFRLWNGVVTMEFSNYTNY